MKSFMDKDFMLSNATAEKLYHDYAAKMPIIDYHCHIDPKEIAEDRRFENITQVWLGGDHYKWRLMRSAGVEEKYITGDSSPREKFQKWAEVLSRAVGNPLYHWSHLELQRYFGYYGTLNGKTAEGVWELANTKLNSSGMSARSIIRKSNVEIICTTDDPADTLEYHKIISKDKTVEFKVLPAWRPDRAMNIEKPDFADYIVKLSAVSGVEINDWDSLQAALTVRMDYFAENGCTVSDHGWEFPYFSPADDKNVNDILKKRLSGDEINENEKLIFKTMFMLFMGSEYRRRGWVMQLHMGAKRDNNIPMYQKIGADTGFDCINSYTSSENIAGFLGILECTDSLPKTILYSLNPHDNEAIDSLIGCFQNSEAVSKIQHGSAWWFNDHETGMRQQLTSLANQGYLAGFVGMLTDSRSFLSYPRHEYFRRILCDLLGTWVEEGKFPADMDILGSIVQDISYNNTKRYFGF